MNDTPHARLQRLLGGERLTALRLRLRRHYERSTPQQSSDGMRLGRLSVSEHAALAQLMGRPPRYSTSMRIDIEAIDIALRDAGIAASLRDALVALDGPILHTATTRELLQAQWQEVIAGSRHADLARLLQRPGGSGLLKRLARQDVGTAIALRERAECVLRRLPAAGIPRAQLAAESLGDAHALDAGQDTASLVLGVLRQDEISGDEPSRYVWARAGVLVNELARPALFLNLPMQSGAPCAHAPGEPGYASLRSLLRAPPAWAVSGRNVYVCENPNLVAIAADRLGPRCAPLVCTDGMPAAAHRTVLSQLAKAGAKLLYHGDFDWPGLHIANHVMREHGAAPWRLHAVDYEAAVGVAPRPGRKLSGTPVLAVWDPSLTAAMHSHDLTIAEEAVAACLLQDLQR